MKTLNSITISAHPDIVFKTASDVFDWPRILPHYRWVRRLGSETRGEIVEMAAYRSGIPVKWTSVMWLDLIKRRIYFKHIGGLTKGMDVVWSIEPTAGGSFVSIIHELTLDVLIINSWPGKLITGKVFVEHVAGETLRCMKEWIENRCAAQSSLD